MKVLITGSAGFIGSALSLQLLERGDEVIGIDNLNDYYDVSLKEARGYLPTVTVRGGEILVAGENASYQLWLYDSNRHYVNSIPASSGAVPLDTITRSQPPLQGGFSFKVYSFVENKNLGVTSGPYYVKP